MTNNKDWSTFVFFFRHNTQPLHLSCWLSLGLFIPLFSLPALYMSAIRQIVAGLICIMSLTIPTGAPRSCLLKDSGATVPSSSPIPWIKLTLGQHQHIMNYGHLPLQTHCSVCGGVTEYRERTGELCMLTAYSLYLIALQRVSVKCLWCNCSEMLKWKFSGKGEFFLCPDFSIKSK